MSLTIACPHCRTPLAVPTEFEGTTGTCRVCGKPVKAVEEFVEVNVESKDPEVQGPTWTLKQYDSSWDWIPVDPNEAAAKYRSDKRVAAVRVLTQAGWIVGNVQLSPAARLIDFLNQQGEFIALIDAFLEGRSKPLDEFALHKSSVYFLAAMDVAAPHSASQLGTIEDRAISCLLPIGSLFAKTRVNRETGTCQYFARQTGFVLVTECRYRVRDPWRNQILDDIEPALLLNSGAIIGISERH
jgi:hypothetical protein